METNTEKGRKGEELAVEYLKSKKYDILERNYRHGRDEIDIIGFAQGTVAFIEVKYRSSAQFGLPEESIDSDKMKRLADCAKGYLMETHHNFPNKRFDVISITEANGKTEIKHIEDAFWP